MTDQPEALQLAEHLELHATHGRGDRRHEAAAELRRLHEKNKRLLEVLKEITPSMPPADAPCHYGIVPQERCRHCGRIAEAIAAIKTVEIGRSMT